MTSPYNADEDPIYGMLPLSETVQQTRFFTLKNGTWADPIQCDLIKDGIATSTPYYAISYAWGEEAGTSGSPNREPIYVNDIEFEASANLVSALRHFRESNSGQRLWADAISHNQRNEIEMNKQVSRMRDIYRKSQEVRVWLGKESSLEHPAARVVLDAKMPSTQWCPLSDGITNDDSSEVFYTSDAKDRCMVKQYSQAFSAFYSLPTAMQYTGSQDFRMGSFCFLHVLARGDHLNHQDLLFIENLSSRDGVFEALKEMMHRSWWTRQWVIQETVLAKVITVHYGRFTIPWSMFARAMENFQIHSKKDCCATHYAKLRTSDLKTLHHFAQTVRDIDIWRSIWLGQRDAPIKLLDILWQFRPRETGRIRDNVYALLPLVRAWGDEKPLEVHYEWEINHIFADLLRLLVDVDNDLLPLMGTTRKSNPNLKIPSWAPDWSVKPDAYELPRLKRALLYHACGLKRGRGNSSSFRPNLKFDTSVQFYMAPEGNRHAFLEVRGKVVDKFQAVHSIGDLMPDGPDGTVRTTFKTWSKLAFSLGGADSLYPVDEGQTKAEAYWRTLCMNTIYKGRENDEDNLPMFKEEYQLAGQDYGREFIPTLTAKTMAHAVDSGHEDCDDEPSPNTGLKRKRNVNESDDFVEFVKPSFGSSKRTTWASPVATPKYAPAGQQRKFNTPRRTATQISEHEPVENENINEAVKSATTCRRFFITADGLMGLGPQEMKEDDVIAVLAGGYTPFVLRHAGEDVIDKVGTKKCYTLVGDCYVHGLMFGEAFKDVDLVDQLDYIYLK